MALSTIIVDVVLHTHSEGKMIKKVCNIEELKTTEEGGKFYLAGYANSKNIEDSYGDIPTNYHDEPVYDVSRLKMNPVLLVDHNNSASNIAGNFVELVEDEQGLKFKALLRNISDIYVDKVKDAVSAYMTGFGRALSIGGDWLFADPEHPSHLTKAIVCEISLVGVGADGSALTDAAYLKNFKTVVPYQNLPLAESGTNWSGSAARSAVLEWAGGDLENKDTQAKYKKAFLWFDSSKLDTKGAYKLPIATVIDGKLKAIPKGIYASAAAVSGARGGIDIPENEKAGVVANIKKYYDKMGEEDPFDKSAFKLSTLSIDERLLESLLKTGVRFSSKQARKLVANIKELHRDGGDSGQWDADQWGKFATQLTDIK